LQPRADGKVELLGLPKIQIRSAFEEAGLEEKQAKLRAKQVWHWIYNRGIGDFAAMSGIELAGIGAGTTYAGFERELRWNQAYHHLVTGP
jgi:hypothetical protein